MATESTLRPGIVGLDMQSQVSMDESFVFMKRGSERRGSQPLNPDEVLCHVPKPSYDCLLALSIIQFLIIVALLMAFGPLGGKTCEFLGHGDTKGNIDVRINTNGNVKEPGEIRQRTMLKTGDSKHPSVLNSGKPISGTQTKLFHRWKLK